MRRKVLAIWMLLACLPASASTSEFREKLRITLTAQYYPPYIDSAAGEAPLTRIVTDAFRLANVDVALAEVPNNRAISGVMGVVKAYATRVGEGPMPSELHDEMGKRLRDNGNEYGAVTGRPRRCGWYDAVAVRYGVRINGLDGLALTKLDVLDGLERIDICTAYRCRSEEHTV